MFAQKLILRSEEQDNAILVDRLVDESLECVTRNETLRGSLLRINSKGHNEFCQQKETLNDKCTKAMFLKIEQRSQVNNNNSVCSDNKVRSTAKPIVL